MIRKHPDGTYRLYSKKINSRTGKRRHLGTFPTLEAEILAKTTGSIL